MRRRIIGSEADHHRRGYPIVSSIGRTRRHRRSWIAAIASAWTALLSLYFGKRP